MSWSMRVIDLDERDHQPAESNHPAQGHPVTRRKMVLGLVAVFVVGALIGGFAVQRRASHEQRERNSVVALVAFPQSASLGSSTFQTASLDAGSGAPQVKMTGHLMVVNAGPAPITVRQAAADRPGLVSASTGRPRLSPLGGTGELVVELLFECSAAFFREPLSLDFEVETEDKHVREVSYRVTLAGSDWQRVAPATCGSA
ncbi:hypothetical protein [Micromonospora chokoriensis]|uniref:Uncharacterized protein n=1 Tax=Micromonospora chokoriensis TaxID=356851 RepID=A0A1C4UXX5_9ACTN|nr:hypothetical protein [Micromonospora chokoriensis]SCE76554.1 hypothetical protein GA0070612_0858 [Micromonospora chokoriensis]